MQSLRLRLILALLTAFVAAWLVGLFFLGVRFHADRSGLWDQGLTTMGNYILQSTPSDVDQLKSIHNAELPSHPPLDDGAHNFGFQVWILTTRDLAMRSAGTAWAPLKPDFRDGLTTRVIEGRQWRVYAVTDADGRIQIQVGKPLEALASDLHTWVKLGLLTTFIMLLVIGGITWAVVVWSLRPVTVLERAITQRDPSDFDPLPAVRMPAEVKPLVAAFNQLLERVERAVSGERQFLADVAHELKTPFAAILNRAQLATLSDDKYDLLSNLSHLIQSAQRGARVSQQLLDSARLEVERQAGEFRQVDIADIVSVVTREFSLMATKQSQIISLQLEPCSIEGDINDLGVLIANLIDNAVRYSGRGGRILVSCAQEGEHVILAVRDSGPGVPGNERDLIFKRFYRASNSPEKGSGIGLSLVARIAASHHAVISTGTGLRERGLSVTIAFPAFGVHPPTAANF